MTWKNYKELQVWEKAMQLADLCFELSVQLLPQEAAALGEQLRRISAEIPSAVAEGYGRGVQRELYRHMMLARGAVYALEITLLLCVRRGYLSEAQAENALELCGALAELLTTTTQHSTRSTQSG